jgi:hypothetical protein
MNNTNRPLTDAELENLFDEVAAKVEVQRAASGSPDGPQFATEEDFIAHIIAECEKDGTPGLIESMIGLGKIFGPPGGYAPKSAAKSVSRHEQIKLLNQNELNQECRNHLPPDWRTDNELHCLSLVLWGLDELKITMPTKGGWPSDATVMSMYLRLERWPPQQAYDWLIGYKDGEDAGVRISADDLRDLSPEEAAAAIVDALVSHLVALE